MFSPFKTGQSRKPIRFLPRLEELEARALPSTYLSTNWSGYAVESPNFSAPANYTVTKVSGSWKVPQVINNTSLGWSSTWVGIDGFSSSTVEQIGTEQDTLATASKYGMPQYYAWYEMYPAYPVTITSVPIHYGDSITASVTYSGTSTDSSGTFTLSITNITTGKSFSINQTLTSAKRSAAEWIEEAPSSTSGVLPLANFQTVTFTGSTATVGSSTDATIGNLNNASINMVTPTLQLKDTTSALNSTGDGFTVTFKSSGSGSGGRPIRHAVAGIETGTIPNLPAAPTNQSSTTVFSVVGPTQTFVASALSQNSQLATFPGLLRDEGRGMRDEARPRFDPASLIPHPSGGGSASPLFFSPSTTDRVVDGPGGTMSRQALDDFFADPVSREQNAAQEVSALVGSTAPAIDVVAGAELSVLLLGAYLGNPIKAKETEDNSKRKVKWLSARLPCAG